MVKQYSLSELCLCIDEALHAELMPTYWVRDEIASLAIRGHCYIELVEKSSGNAIAAKVRATCWNHVYNLLAPFFAHETGQSLAIGMQVLLEVEIHFHAVYGLSLNIVGIDPTFTIGDIARQRQQTILRLQQDGIIDMQRSISIPRLPRRIAVISAAEAAGYGDFCHQLRNNPYGFHFHTQLFPALMQGEQSALSIIRALMQIAEEFQNWDVVAIVRGGGATTDLQHFDDYELASHCAQFPLPIVTGIGHTRDNSIVDMVVHTSVKTPTAAAEWLINILLRQAQALQELHHRLYKSIQQATKNELQRLSYYQQHVQLIAQTHLQKQHAKLTLWEKTIAIHSPERIYRMGYSLTTMNGKIIKSIHDIQTNQQIQTHLTDGILISKVLNKS